MKTAYQELKATRAQPGNCHFSIADFLNVRLFAHKTAYVAVDDHPNKNDFPPLRKPSGSEE